MVVGNSGSSLTAHPEAPFFISARISPTWMHSDGRCNSDENSLTAHPEAPFFISVLAECTPWRHSTPFCVTTSDKIILAYVQLETVGYKLHTCFM